MMLIRVKYIKLNSTLPTLNRGGDLRLYKGGFKVSSITCPLCGGNMIYKKCNSTHIWKCQDCPAILFEYYGIKDIKNLKRELGPECKHEKLTEIHLLFLLPYFTFG